MAHREWIAGRAITLLSHYWRDDDPDQLTAAIGADWADVLEGLEQKFIQRACIIYQQREDRKKPTPGAIYKIVREIMPKPVLVREPEPEREPPATQERAAEILRQAGVKVNKFGGVESL